MDEIKELAAGVIRTSKELSDGRIIRYYDTHGQRRSNIDTRESAEQPGIGELRLDPLTNEWIAVSHHR